MSIFPRDEYQPRRGVAMRIVEPNPNLKRGQPRDARLEQEARKFQDQEFILSKAMSDKQAKPTKVKTFGRNDIPWASGNGNVIAPPKPEPTTYRKIIGHRVPEDKMHKYYHGDALDRCRQAEADRMQHACNFSDNFSPQPPDRMHKIVPHTIQPTKGLAPINGFPGLGSVVRERGTGKANVSETTFDPLGMRSWAPRATGLKRLPESNKASMSEGTLSYDDGVAFESTQKKKYRTPHRHVAVPTHGPDQDLQGFRGLGAVDPPPLAHGRRHSPRQHQDHHSLPMTGMQPSPHQQSYHHQQEQTSGTFRSASSLGMASPQHHQHGPAHGRSSAPPGMGSSVRFHPSQN